MELIRRDINFDFLSKRKQAVMLSMVLILAGLISLVIHGGPDLGIEFTGGVLVELHFENAEDIADIRDALSDINLGNSEIKVFGTPNDILITTEQLESIGSQDNSQLSASIIQAFSNRFQGNTVTESRVESIGPKIGEELVGSTVSSIALALVFLMIYISWRFEFKFAIGAVVALMHDVLITVGMFSILGKEITLPIVAALLTIIGYSLNDTIVVSDRIRENLKVLRRENFNDIINRSLNQTLSRTVITSLTTLMVVVILFIWGSEVIKDFSLALIIGVSIGTYSSLFVATPIVVKYHEMQEAKKKLK